MRIASGISTQDDPHLLSTELSEQISKALDGTQPDLLMLFVTAAHQPNIANISRTLRQQLKPRQFLGTTAESVIGGEQEVERKPAASIMAMSFDNVRVESFHIAQEEWEDLLNSKEAVKNRLGSAEDTRGFIMIADPFTVPIVQFLDACSAALPQAPITGGMASALPQPDGVRLVLNDEVHTSGLIGVSIAGNIQMDCVVSQGCRPVGDTFVITKTGERNVIEQLNGKPALQAIEEMITGLPIEDRELLHTHGLQMGRVIDQGKGHYGRGDFLIRSIIDVQRQTGAIIVGDRVSTGMTIQFHVRDANAADEDIRLLLQGEMLLASTPSAALLFSCSGRGTRLFPLPDHDVGVVRELFGNIPVAGFFCAGEIGPVGRRNFIHGQTASLALLRPVEDEPS